MAMLDELEKQIGAAEKELHDAVSRLRAFAELEASLAAASGGVKAGAEGLARLSENLTDTTGQLQKALAEFTGAAEAVKNANPQTLTAGVEAVRHSVEQMVDAADRLHTDTGGFQTELKEELGEQREAIERRIQAVESGLEQTRGNLTQLKNRLDQGFDEAAQSTLAIGRSVRPWLVVIVLLQLAIAAAVGWPYYQKLQPGAVTSAVPGSVQIGDAMPLR